jgi:hypothetical protein
MYVSSMKSDTYPLAMPPDLLGEVRQTAVETGLSMADAMRQSIRLGLPKLKEQLSVKQLKPLTAAECEQCWGTQEDEFDRLAAHCSALPASEPE